MAQRGKEQIRHARAITEAWAARGKTADVWMDRGEGGLCDFLKGCQCSAPMPSAPSMAFHPPLARSWGITGACAAFERDREMTS